MCITHISMRLYAYVVNSGSPSSNRLGKAASTVIDINHPYFLSYADHPGLSLVTEVLNDQNYAHWSRSITIALLAKLKLGFIDGTQVKPADTSPHFALWKRSNDLVIS